MQFTKFIIPLLLLSLLACEQKTTENSGPAGPPISNEAKPETPIFTSDNVNFGAVDNLERYRDSLSYAIGRYLAQSFEKQDLKIKPSILTQGYVDIIKDQGGLSHKSAISYLGKVKNIQTYRTKARSGTYPFPLSLDSVSYAIGADMGYQQKGTNYELHADPFHQGLTDAQSRNLSKISQNDQDKFMALFFKGMKSAIKEKNEGKVDNTPEAEVAFFKKNRSEPGLVSMPSGLQYQIINSGAGPKATYIDEVMVKYEAKSIEGKILDGNREESTPVKVKISEMIPGWVEGLQMMSKGAKYRFFVPSDLAYGEEGYQNIPPNTALIYEIEIVEVL